MLKEIELNNFLSYQHVKVAFTPDATIAVVGDNGNGKSGLLEAILFCLYGEGRDDLQKLIRIGSTSEMKVRLVLTDVPSKGKTFVVERGVKKTGAGFCKVWLGDNLMSQGGAKPSNNKAQDFIDNVLGMPYSSFLLTSFFGMGTNDSLMQVPPSTRLETLQKLAGVDICAEFNKKAIEHVKELSAAVDADERVSVSLRESNYNIDDLNQEKKLKLEELSLCKKRMEMVQEERTALSKEEVKYQNLLHELDSIRIKRESKTTQKDRVQRDITSANREYRSLKTEALDFLTRKTDCENRLNELPKEEINNKFNELYSRISDNNAKMNMRNSAFTLTSSKSICPLCGADVDESILAHWTAEISELSNAVTSDKDTAAVLQTKLEEISVLEKKLEKLSANMQSNVKQITLSEKELKTLEKELSVYSAELESLDTRMVTVKHELKAFDSIVQNITEMDETMSKLHRKEGELSQAVSDVKARIAKCAAGNSKIDSIEETIAANKKKIIIYKTVADAFSRYAIPIALLKNLITSIERRSTRVYQYFNAGVIRIDSVEGARPGVDFVLYDEMGSRSYKALSTGEKVMVFLSIRIAITQVLNAVNNNKVDFLILDEVTGNLSPDKRDSLTKLINTLLRKNFNQVFMVSHVELRDIFNTTLLVKKIEGVSEVTVL
jgi:exonuclease SbcC